MIFQSFKIFPWLVSSILLLVPAIGCGGDERAGNGQHVTGSEAGESETSEAETGEAEAGGDESAVGEPGESADGDGQSLTCDQVTHMSITGGEGTGVPGDAGAVRWGLPDNAKTHLRIRRSWSTLSDAEKQRVADGFLKLKQTTVESARPGAERAGYRSFCAEAPYARNLYDYYVELHTAAFTMMSTADMSHQQMPHMGPQFLPWHRYVLLRIEADMGTVLGDPGFALPYWDMTDCQAEAQDGENPCPELFDERFLGSAGSCDEEADSVEGTLIDQGFQKNIWTEAELETVFNLASVRCSSAPLRRRAGCEIAKPATSADFAGIFERKVYDAEPYDSCHTDESVSFRQYLEGYKVGDTEIICWIGGCENHGRGHLYIGGDMGLGGAPTNDPLFFLHHANIDRAWAMWQDRNRATSETAVNYGNPGYPDAWTGSIFNFPEVEVAELFDFRSLGFTYDTLR